MTIVQASNNIEVRVLDQDIKLPITKEEEVNRLWEIAKTQGKTNGEVLGYLTHSLTKNKLNIYTCFGQYKHFFAQINNRELGHIIHPLAVCGIISDADGNVLVGRRSAEVTQYKNHFEFVPSGGLKKDDQEKQYIDTKKGILRRLTAETIFDLNDTAKIEVLGLIYDPMDGVYDIAHHIKLKEQFPEGKLVKPEYYEEQIVQIKDIPALINSNDVTPSMPLISLLID